MAHDVKSRPEKPYGALMVERLKHGGYRVREAPSFLTDPGQYLEELYACSELEEALDWIKGALATGPSEPRW